jgi:hypothetical protein
LKTGFSKWGRFAAQIPLAITSSVTPIGFYRTAVFPRLLEAEDDLEEISQ